MPHAPYIRFRHTVDDLEDCLRHVLDMNLHSQEDFARTTLVDICKQIIFAFDKERNEDYEDRLATMSESFRLASEEIVRLKTAIRTLEESYKNQAEELHAAIRTSFDLETDSRVTKARLLSELARTDAVCVSGLKKLNRIQLILNKE